MHKLKRYLTGSDGNDTSASEEPKQKSPTTSNIPVAINTHVVNVELEQLDGHWTDQICDGSQWKYPEVKKANKVVQSMWIGRRQNKYM